MLDPLLHGRSHRRAGWRDLLAYAHAVEPQDHLAAIGPPHHRELVQGPPRIGICLDEALEPQGRQALTGRKKDIVAAPLFEQG